MRCEDKETPTSLSLKAGETGRREKYFKDFGYKDECNGVVGRGSNRVTVCVYFHLLNEMKTLMFTC